jgi:hypothetical protein
MDADPIKECSCDSIELGGYKITGNIAKDTVFIKQMPNWHKYSCEKNYSQFYKDKLKKDKSKCGRIYLSEAIALIQEHFAELPPSEKTSNTKIKIFIASCMSVFKEVISYAPWTVEHTFVNKLTDYRPTTLEPRYSKHTTKHYYLVINNRNYHFIFPKTILDGLPKSSNTNFTFLAKRYINAIIKSDINETNLPINIYIDLTGFKELVAQINTEYALIKHVGKPDTEKDLYKLILAGIKKAEIKKI